MSIALTLSADRTARLHEITAAGLATYDLTTPTGAGRNLCAQLADWPVCDHVALSEDGADLFAMDPEDGTSITVASYTVEDLAGMLEGALDAPKPPVRKVATPLAIVRILTPQEEADIFESDDPTTRLFARRFVVASEIVSDDPDTVAGMQYLVSRGVFTEARLAEIWEEAARA